MKVISNLDIVSLCIGFTLSFFLQVYVIGGDGSQRGAGVIFEVSSTINQKKALFKLIELELLLSTFCRL